MAADSTTLQEFLKEVNRAVTSQEYSSDLLDLFTPIRNLLLAQKDLISYSIARHAGADSELAFFCQWYCLNVEVTSNPEALNTENYNYFSKKVPLKLRGIPNLKELISADINKIFLPRQLVLMQQKTQDYIQVLTSKQPALQKYLDRAFLNKILASELTSVKKLYQEEQTLNQYLDAQNVRTSFALVGLPCLLGLANYFGKPDRKTLQQGVKWSLVEDVLRQISTLHQTGTSLDFQEYVYASRLSEKDEFFWWPLSRSEKQKKAMASSEAREIVKEIREKIHQATVNNLEATNLPPTFMEMLKDLLNWAFKLK